MGSFWINPPVAKNVHYRPAKGEHIMNMLTQLTFFIAGSLVWFFMLWHVSSSMYALIIFFLHGLSYLIMFLVSFYFHWLAYSEWGTKRVGRWHLYDRLTIYFLIAAGYTPWLTIPTLSGVLGQHMWWLVWLLGIAGCAYSVIFLNCWKALETMIYAVYGLLPVVPLFQSMVPGIEHIVYGGAIIIIGGIPFFKLDGYVPCSHAIWHTAVAIGSSWHYWAAYQYLVPMALSQ